MTSKIDPETVPVYKVIFIFTYFLFSWVSFFHDYRHIMGNNFYLRALCGFRFIVTLSFYIFFIVKSIYNITTKINTKNWSLKLLFFVFFNIFSFVILSFLILIYLYIFDFSSDFWSTIYLNFWIFFPILPLYLYEK